MVALARRARLTLLAAALCTACGGGASSPAAPTPAPSASPDPAKLVVLEAGDFEALVLAPGRTSLVEFQLPT